MADESSSSSEVSIKKHAMYFKRCMDVLPSQCEALDTSRMTLLFFCLSGLDVLNSLETIEDRKAEIIDWIYAQQILPDATNPEANRHKCGFRGSTSLGVPYDNTRSPSAHPNDCSHIAMTYTALASLLILGDDLSRVDKSAVLHGVRELQQPNGSFCSTIYGTEMDMRFVYCACCICYMLKDWSGLERERSCDFIRNSMGYDYGIAQGPLLESHGGSTFCAVASLALMESLDTFSERELDRLRRWCISRQMTGFQGRPNKPVDTCYSFWIGASLRILGCGDLINTDLNTSYILSTEGEFSGGFSKWPDTFPDPLHSYLGLCGLSLTGHPQLQPINAALNISQRAADWLASLSL